LVGRSGQEDGSPTADRSPIGDGSPADSHAGAGIDAWIAFDSDRLGGGRAIHVMRRDGSGLHGLTSGVGIDSEPKFSFDGSKLLFTSRRSGTEQIFVMDLRTRETTQVTKRPAGAYRGAFSPDGTRVAYIGGEPASPDSAVEAGIVDMSLLPVMMAPPNV